MMIKNRDRSGYNSSLFDLSGGGAGVRLRGHSGGIKHWQRKGQGLYVVRAGERICIVAGG